MFGGGERGREGDQETIPTPRAALSLSQKLNGCVYLLPLNVSSQGSVNILYLTVGNISFNLIFRSLPHSVCSRAAVKFAAVWQVLHGLNGRRVLRHISP